MKREKIKSFIKRTRLYVYIKFFVFKLNKPNKNSDELSKKFFSLFINKDDLCFDIGANIGKKSAIFYSIGAKVIAIEPQKYCYRFLKLRFGSKIIILRNAIGSKKERGLIYVSDSDTISSMSLDWIERVKMKRFKEFTWERIEEIDIITLNDLIRKFGVPNFCKIDVEGYEYEVLKGLNQKIPFISFEYNFPESFSITLKCIEYLGSLGEILCNYSEGENINCKFQNWQSKDNFLKNLKQLEKPNSNWGDIYIKFL